MADRSGLSDWACGAAGAVVLHAALIASAAALFELPEKSAATETRISFADVGFAELPVAAVPRELASALATDEALRPAEDEAQPAGIAQDASTIRQVDDVAAAARAAAPEATAPRTTPQAAERAAEAAALSPVEAQRAAPADRAEIAAPVSDAVQAATATAPRQAAPAAEPLRVARSNEAEAAERPREFVAPERPSVDAAGPAERTRPVREPSLRPGIASVGPAQAAQAAPPRVTEEVAAPSSSAATATPTLPQIAGRAPVESALPPPAPRLSAASPIEAAESAAPVAPPQSEEVTLLAPLARNPQPTRPVDPAAQAWRRAIRFLQADAPQDCFLALPAYEASAGTIRSFAADAALQSEFAERLGRAESLPEHERVDRVSEAQCRALAFVRTLPRYPAFALTIQVENPHIASGEALVGRISNVDGRVLSLLLVDDEGFVQDVEPFLRRTGARDPAFVAPLVLTGDPETTTQLLLAIASDTPLDTVKLHSGAEAGEFFEILEQEINRRAADIEVALQPFSVR